MVYDFNATQKSDLMVKFEMTNKKKGHEPVVLLSRHQDCQATKIVKVKENAKTTVARDTTSIRTKDKHIYIMVEGTQYELRTYVPKLGHQTGL